MIQKLYYTHTYHQYKGYQYKKCTPLILEFILTLMHRPQCKLILLAIFANPSVSFLISVENNIHGDVPQGIRPVHCHHAAPASLLRIDLNPSGNYLTHYQRLPFHHEVLTLRGGGEFKDVNEACETWRVQTIRLRGAGDPEAMGSKMVEIALQAERNGVDLASVLKTNSSSTAGIFPSQGKKMDAKARELGQVQLEACQMVMDDCYDNAIRPLVEELENKIFAGDVHIAEQGGFAPYKGFSKDGAELMSNCRIVIDKAVKQLQAQVCATSCLMQGKAAAIGADRNDLMVCLQLEVIQFASVNEGRPVSSVEFEKVKVDMRPVRPLVVKRRATPCREVARPFAAIRLAVCVCVRACVRACVRGWGR